MPLRYILFAKTSGTVPASAFGGRRIPIRSTMREQNNRKRLRGEDYFANSGRGQIFPVRELSDKSGLSQASGVEIKSFGELQVYGDDIT